MNKGSWLVASAAIALLSACAAAPEAPVASAPVPPPAVAEVPPPANPPWRDVERPVDERVSALLAAMTTEEKLTLIFGYFGSDFPPKQFTAPAAARPGSAGYVPGIPRLGIPPRWETDAGIGVASQGGAKVKLGRTALPSGIATAATWDPEIGFAGGRMIGSEARNTGFNVMLAGGVNLLREPRNGRNFEYGGEDPLLAGTMVGSQIAGIQSNKIVSTIKHYAVNDQETDRNSGNSVIEEAALRQSDLLAFQFAFERGQPGSVMCAYNKVNGDYACENRFLLGQVLRDEWKWPGYVMSDWGATHSTVKASEAGLDQQSGWPFDDKPYYGELMAKAVASGEVSMAALDRKVRNILHSLFVHGVYDNPVAPGPIDFAANREVTRKDAEAGIVLLRNERGVLPLNPAAKRIVVIGGHADKGVLSGGGSSQVYPEGGINAVQGVGPTTWPGPTMYFPSAPLTELKKAMPGVQFDFIDGTDKAAAARLARGADAAIVFANLWAGESFDVSLTLPDNQDALIDAVAGANSRTVVVVQSGGPILTPWRSKVAGLMMAWYPGSAGGEAIANLLTGRVNPSGHLPATFPDSLAQLPHPGEPKPGDVVYTEGATVGYKWFDAKGLNPAYPFGHGLSYTTFSHTGLRAQPSGNGIAAEVTVTNTGKRRGADVVQLYVEGAGWEAPRRLGGFARVELDPGEKRTVQVKVDPRLLAVWKDGGWHIAGGTYRVVAGQSSRQLGERVSVNVAAAHLPAGWKPN